MGDRLKRRPRVGDIIFVAIPDREPHPAVVVLEVNDRFIVMTGTSSPQDEVPASELSDAVARSVGLDRKTGFYQKWIYIWTPAMPTAVEIVGAFPASSFVEVRQAVTHALGQMGPEIGAKLPRLPVDCPLKLEDVKKLAALSRAAQSSIAAASSAPSDG